MMKILDIKHTKQPNKYSCGPICLEMILNFFDVDSNRNELTALTKVHKEHGTDNDNMIKALKAKGLSCESMEGSDIADIIMALNKNLPVIINYINPESGIGHYAVIRGYKKDQLVLADPKNGDNYLVSFESFLDHWSNSDKTIKRWMLVAQRT